MQQAINISNIYKGALVSKRRKQFSQLLRAGFVCAFRKANEEMIAGFTAVTPVNSSWRINGSDCGKKVCERTSHARNLAAAAGRTGPREHGTTISQYRGVF